VTTILVPPGIGDIYWVLVKLRGFCRAHGIATPEIWIDAPDDKKRSAEFVERVPFVRFGSYHDASGMSPAEAAQPMAGWKRRKSRVNPVREEAYLCDGRHAFPDFEGFDWFLSFNGSINAGRSLDEIEPGWPTRSFATTGNGDQMPLDQHGYYGAALRDWIGAYIAAAFFDHGFYRRWLMQMPADAIYRMLFRICDETSCRVVLTGAAWDHSAVNRALLDMDDGRLVSLIGETTLEEYFGALRAARGCIGFPAGNTMMGAVFGVPTVLIWHDFFPAAMHVNALPKVPNYRAMNTKHTADELAAAFVALQTEFT